MKVTFDRKANAVYIYLISPDDPAYTVGKTHLVDPPHMKGSLVLDLSTRGRLLGIEVLNATAVLPRELIEGAERI